MIINQLFRTRRTSIKRTLATSKTSSPKSPTAVKMSLACVHQRVAVFHSLYKHLLKRDITEMSEVMSRAQPYIQLEEVMRSFVNQSLKGGADEEKSKSRHEAPTYVGKSESGATRPQKTGVPDPLFESTSNLQDGTTLHFVEAPHQRSL